MRRIRNFLFHIRKSVALAVFVCVPAVGASNFLSSGHSLAQSTYLIELSQDSPLSLKARALRLGGFETSGGDWVGFNRWYSANWNDTRLSWMTQFSPNLGLLWGVSSGEKAEKYVIDPGVRLGFLFQTQPARHSLLTISASTVLGGRLREKSCTADYGDIGGVQQVNCRLAATLLEPSETLNYLHYEKPETTLQIRYRRSFF
jgi:hypothetical protein